MDYIKDLLYYVTFTVQIKNKAINNKEKKYNFLTDDMIFFLKSNINIIKECYDIINLNNNNYINIINNKYKNNLKKNIILSIVDNYYNKNNSMLSTSEIDLKNYSQFL